jgi:hypothetical protein
MALHRQRGVTMAMVIVVLVIVLISVLATYAVSRIKTGTQDAAITNTRMAKAVEALEAFATAAQRLPCPSDPAIDATAIPADVNEGMERVDGANSARCQFPQGTLPWRTIGMKQEEAVDAWGRKLSYRVYTGNAGSLTQAGGVSMVYCDTNEPTPGGTTATAASSGGLCKGAADVSLRSTTTAQFLDNKGLTVSDTGAPPHNDVAYVIESHGATGLGGYTVSGMRLDMPAGDELSNTRDTGPFTIKAFSDVTVAAGSIDHFDDVLLYRTLSDLVKRINLSARDWPESLSIATADRNVAFTQLAVSTALSRPVSLGASLGQGTLNLGGVQVVGQTSGTTSDLSFGESSLPYAGLGVAGGGSSYLQSSANESLRVDLDAQYEQFGITLADFGFYGFFFVETVQFDFYLNGSLVASPVLTACRFDGGLASFSFSARTLFDRVDIKPLSAPNVFGGSGITAFLVSEIAVCPASSPTCRTLLDDTVASARCS